MGNFIFSFSKQDKHYGRKLLELLESAPKSGKIINNLKIMNNINIFENFFEL